MSEATPKKVKRIAKKRTTKESTKNSIDLITPEEAFQEFCLLGKTRSIEKLHQKIATDWETEGKRRPRNNKTLYSWRDKYDWLERVKSYDDKAIERLNDSIMELYENMLIETKGFDIYDTLVVDLVNKYQKQIDDLKDDDKYSDKFVDNPETLAKLYDSRQKFYSVKTQFMDKLMRYIQAEQDRKIKKEELDLHKKLFNYREIEYQKKQKIQDAELRAKEAQAELRELQLLDVKKKLKSVTEKEERGFSIEIVQPTIQEPNENKS